MEKGQKRTSILLRSASVLLGLLIAFSLLFSGLFLYAEMDHECEEEHCPICEIMAQCEKVLSGMKEVCCHSGLSVIGLSVLFAIITLSVWVQVRPTPVSRKIQLNN